MKKFDGYEPFVLWFTGLSGAGKSTLADKVFEILESRQVPVEKLDGDTLRGIFKATGFTKEARDEHIRRVGFMASLLEKHGVIVVASFISPYRDTRAQVRGMCRRFIEIYVNASIEECENRDIKGLYKKARAGQISNFTGLDDPYQPPENPDIIVNTDNQTVEESVSLIMDFIGQYIKG